MQYAGILTMPGVWAVLDHAGNVVNHGKIDWDTVSNDDDGGLTVLTEALTYDPYIDVGVNSSDVPYYKKSAYCTRYGTIRGILIAAKAINDPGCCDYIVIRSDVWKKFFHIRKEQYVEVIQRWPGIKDSHEAQQAALLAEYVRIKNSD